MRTVTRTLLLLPILMGFFFNAAAQARISSGFPIPGVRPQGMGGAFVAIADDINSIVQNPAGLALIKDKQVQVSHTDLYGLGIDFNYLAYCQKYFGASWAHIDSGSFLMGGGSFSQDMFMFSGSYNVEPQMYLGASLKIIRQSYSPPSAGAVAIDPTKLSAVPALSLGSDGYSLDVGLLYQVDSSTTVGAIARDLLGSLKTSNSVVSYGKDRFNPDINFGFSRRSKLSLFSVQVGRAGGESVVHLGAERQIEEHIKLRVGVDDDIFTAGVGFYEREWEFDYAWKNESGMGLDKTSRFGAVVHFK